MGHYGTVYCTPSGNAFFGTEYRSRPLYCSIGFANACQLSHSKEWIKSVARVDTLNSVVVPLQEIERHISAILSALGLNYSTKFFELFRSQSRPESATYVAIRFLSRADSEKPSYLKITPSPQKFTRIMMIYKWLDDELDNLAWPTASLDHTTESKVWKEIVGAEATDSPTNRDIFSVYQITWLEVL
ncbi:hypothetical protein FRC12_009097 [Ceratobasidium sp. 428]|nr:hypothetical protein FRC12_009097 [Ceratobasidium sp. 428]